MSETKDELIRIIGQLEDLKRLTVMQLLMSGAQGGHIAEALDIDASTISKWMPVREIKKLAAKQSQDNG